MINEKPVNVRDFSLRAVSTPKRLMALLCAATLSSGGAGAQTDTEQLDVGSDHIEFPISCVDASSETFNRGVALLHSFWFADAINTFNQVLAKDPDCDIAYWGIALAHWGNPFAGQRNAQQLARGSSTLEQAGQAGSAREQAYLNAVSALFSDHDPGNQRNRTLAYEEAMANLVADYPDDMEAKIFYALSVNQNASANDQSYSKQLQAAAILEPLFEQHPEHPGLAHYIIHAYDHPPLAERALTAAERYASLAPDAPHALHMPSHTFTRVGRWQASVDTNLRSAAAAQNDGDPGSELHALDYLAYAYLQMARDTEAAVVVARANELRAEVDITAVGATQAGAFAIAAIPARYALEREQWEQAAGLDIVPAETPHTQAMTHFARVIGAARSGQPEQATGDIAMLEELHERAQARQDSYWQEQIAIQLQAARAWVHFASDEPVDAIHLMAAAADREDNTDKAAVTPGPLVPTREMLADMLMAHDDPEQALAAYQATLRREPNRFRAIAGAAKAAEVIGNQQLATDYYQQLLDMAEGQMHNRPDLQRAREFVGN